MAYSGRRPTSTVTLPERVRSDGRVVKPDPEERLKARISKNSAYDKYKEQLNALFDGKRELPQQLKDMLATRPGAEAHGFEQKEEPESETKSAKGKKKRKKKSEPASKGTRRRVAKGGAQRATFVNALKEAHSPKAIEQCIDELLGAGFTLPMEYDLLSKALTHPNETVLAEALRGLVTVLEEPAPKGANLLKGRLENVAMLAKSSEVRELCEQVQDRLA